MYFLETSLTNLYRSTVDAFPKTLKRQNSIDSIVIENLNWVPFLGVKTLFIKGIAKNEGKKYDSIILIKNMIFEEKQGKNIIKIKMSDGKEYYVKKVNIEENNVSVRCNCEDFYWRGNYANSLDKSLYGRKRSKYESKTNRPMVNPNNSPMMCKHLIKLTKILKESNLFDD